jgi:hypothetical protein
MAQTPASLTLLNHSSYCLATSAACFQIPDLLCPHRGGGALKVLRVVQGEVT